MTKVITSLAFCVLLAGCASEVHTDYVRRDEVSALESRIAQLEKDRDILATASKNNSDAIISNSHSIENLTSAGHSTLGMIRILSKR